MPHDATSIREPVHTTHSPAVTQPQRQTLFMPISQMDPRNLQPLSQGLRAQELRGRGLGPGGL